MENILFYLLTILCIGLIIALAVYIKRYNKERELNMKQYQEICKLENIVIRLNGRISELEKKITRKGTKWKKRSENPEIITVYDYYKAMTSK